jgi:zinc protease
VSHLFHVIRETRGLNYGDYSYIEAFPEGGERNMPPVNVARRQQLFEVWIRTLPNDKAVFALRAALRELTALVDHGLTQEQFELSRTFLKYSLHFAETTSPSATQWTTVSMTSGESTAKATSRASAR